MRKVLATLLGSMMLFTASVAAQGEYEAASSDDIKVVFDGQLLEFDQPPIMEEDRVLVPMRVIFESFGALVGWDGETNTVMALKDEDIVIMQIGNSNLYKNAESIEIIPPKLINDRTLVPVRAVSESFNAKVEWDPDNKTVLIFSAE